MNFDKEDKKSKSEKKCFFLGGSRGGGGECEGAGMGFSYRRRPD